MSDSKQTYLNGVLAAVGAAGAVGGFTILIAPKHKKLAIALAILVLALSLGVIQLIWEVF